MRFAAFFVLAAPPWSCNPGEKPPTARQDVEAAEAERSQLLAEDTAISAEAGRNKEALARARAAKGLGPGGLDRIERLESLVADSELRKDAIYRRLMELDVELRELRAVAAKEERAARPKPKSRRR